MLKCKNQHIKYTIGGWGFSAVVIVLTLQAQGPKLDL